VASEHSQALSGNSANRSRDSLLTAHCPYLLVNSDKESFDIKHYKNTDPRYFVVGPRCRLHGGRLCCATVHNFLQWDRRNNTVEC
jgi:hypothetical protein